MAYVGINGKTGKTTSIHWWWISILIIQRGLQQPLPVWKICLGKWSGELWLIWGHSVSEEPVALQSCIAIPILHLNEKFLWKNVPTCVMDHICYKFTDVAITRPFLRDSKLNIWIWVQNYLKCFSKGASQKVLLYVKVLF